MSLLNDLPYLIIVGFLFGSYKLATEPALVTRAGETVAQAAAALAQYLDLDALLPDSAAVCELSMHGTRLNRVLYRARRRLRAPRSREGPVRCM